MGEKTGTVRTVEVVKRPGQGLGLYLRDGGDRSDGVFVSRVVPGSVADLNGALAVGDEILAVDGVSVAGRELEDVVVSMSIPRRLVLDVRRTRFPAPLGDADEGSTPVVVVKRGGSVYAERPRSYCCSPSYPAAGTVRSPERFLFTGASRGLYPRSLSVDFRRIEDRSEDVFDHLRAVLADDSGDSGLSSDNSGMSRLTLEPVHHIGTAVQKPLTGFLDSSFANLDLGAGLLTVKSNTSSPRFGCRTVPLHPALRRSGECFGTLSDSDAMYARNSRVISVCKRMSTDASFGGMQSNIFPDRTSSSSCHPAGKHSKRTDFDMEQCPRSDNYGQNSWYSDCKMLDGDTCQRLHYPNDFLIPSSSLPRCDSDLTLRQNRLSRSSVLPGSCGKPNIDIPEDLKDADLLLMPMFEDRNHRAVMKLLSCYPDWSLARVKQHLNVETVNGSGDSSCMSDGNRHSWHQSKNPTTLNKDSNLKETCELQEMALSPGGPLFPRYVYGSSQGLGHLPSNWNSGDRVYKCCRPLQLRKDAFKEYPGSNPKTQSCDDCGLNGAMSVHIFCAHQLSSLVDGNTARFCIVNVDNVMLAKTMAYFSFQDFDWDEKFTLYLQDARVLSFVVLNAEEQTGSDDPRFAVSVQVGPLFARERHQRLCLRLKPLGELYVELVYALPQNVFTRMPSVHARAVFGTDLETVVKSNGVPLLVLRCVEEVELRGLDQRGIYRLSGCRRQVDVVRENLEQNLEMTDLSERAVKDINVITGVLKEFLRDLPEPLCTNALHEMFFEALMVQVPQDTKGNAELMLSIVDCLPKPYLDTLTYLLNHLTQVLLHSGKNRMTITDLSICLGPLIFCPALNGVDLLKVSQSKTLWFKNHSRMLAYLLEIWMAK